MGSPMTMDVLLQATAEHRSDFEERSRQTIGLLPPHHSTGGERAVRALAGLAEQDTVEVRETLGQGGMAVVRLGHQASLGRDVAVKMLRPDRPMEVGRLRLLREAWVTGQLEHPNIVPVHDVRIDEDGAPRILLKRVEGAVWSDILSDAALAAQLIGERDPLSWHVDVLISTCRAIEFAHSRQILHRDIKPDNVMVGPYGEVTVLDWGIAGSLQSDPTGRLPVLKPGNIAGTPAYMAPEMAAGEALSPQTDVYLLGAVLYEILAGHPPHRGASIQELLRSVLSPPPLPDTAPPMLAQLCRSAMAAVPDLRPRSVSALRQELESFLELQAVDAIIQAADGALRDLQDAIARSEDAAVQAHFSKSQFGFTHAREVWPDHPRPQPGLDAAHSLMVRWALAQDALELAAHHIAQVDTPEPALAAALEAARQVRDEQAAALSALAAAHNPQANRTARTLVILALSTTAGAIGFINQALGTPITYTVNVLGGAGLMAVVLAGSRLSRTNSDSDAYNQRIYKLAAIIPLGVLSASLSGWLQGWSAEETSTTMFLCVVATFYAMAVTADRRHWVGVVVALVGWAVTSLSPGWIHGVVGVMSLVLGIYTVWLDRQDASDTRRRLLS